MRALFRRAANSPFLRHSAVLTGGSFISLLIPLILLPVFTRIYSAELYGIQALLLVGMVAFAPLASGYFDVAIPTVKKTSDARALANLALACVLALSLIALLMMYVAQPFITATLNLSAIGGWIYGFPVIIGAAAVANIANYWLLRAEKHGTQGMIKIVAAVATAILAYGTHLLGIADGLLIGCVGGFVVAALWGLYRIKTHGFKLEIPSLMIAHRFRDFPRYGSIPTAIYNLATQIPLLIITAHYSLKEAGEYGVIRGLLFAGALLIVMSVGQVLLQHISTRRHARQPIWPYFLHITAWLAGIGILLSAAMYVVGPWFFTFYLGAHWHAAAELTRTLSVLLFFWLMGPTLAQAAIALHCVKPVAAWQVAYGLGALGLFMFTQLSFDAFMMRYVLFDAIAYGLYALLMIVTVYRRTRASR